MKLYLKRLCYGKYNSALRIKKIGMQDITELDQFAFRRAFHLNSFIFKK
ncbi:MAG: hypothetical protein FWE74_08115 [Oscillospiraceae bacterium]|nr:hypothetical protein [Oscillospiraceae bacterium]